MFARRIYAAMLTPFAILGLLPFFASAQAPKPIRARITQINAQELRLGSTIVKRAPGLQVLKGSMASKWEHLAKHDLVAYSPLKEKRTLTVLAPASLVQKTIPFIALRPVVAQDFEASSDTLIMSGRAFREWIRFRREATFENKEDADSFECWVGLNDSSFEHGRDETCTFAINLDGERVFTTPLMHQHDQPIHILLPIKGKGAITLVQIESRNANSWPPAWGQPRFLKRQAGLVQLGLPSDGAKVTRDTDLTWEGVEGAEGYLLEIQCHIVENPKDRNDSRRFQSFMLKPDATGYRISPSQLVKGVYRWRIHALAGSSFLGEMSQWRMFNIP